MKHFVQFLRRTAEAVLSGHKGKYAQQAAWTVLSMHPKLRAVRLAQQGNISTPLKLLSQYESKDAGYQRIKARLADMADFLQQHQDTLPKQNLPLHLFNGKVLFALHSCGAFDPSGYASRSVALIKALTDLGVESFITARPGYPWDLAGHQDIPKCTEIAHGGLHFQLTPETAFNIHVPESKYIEAYSEHLVRLSQSYDVSVIHAASNYLNGSAAALAGRLLGVPSIYEVRGLWHLTRAFSEPGYAATEHYQYCEQRELAACRQVDQVITLSGGLRQWLIERGISAQKIVVVGNAAVKPVQDQAFLKQSGAAIRNRLGIPLTSTVVGYLGALVEYEGLVNLFYAHARTPAEKRPYLLIVGDGKQEVALHKLARKLGTNRKVIFAGRVGADQVAAHYASMDVLILPRQDDILTRLVPAIKPFEILANNRPLFISPSLAEALGDTLPDGYSVVDVASVTRLDQLIHHSINPGNVSVPTWHDRAEQVLSLYRRLSLNPTT